MRILVAEDEKSLNRVITKRLESEGYSVDSCFNGEDALDYMYVGEFDAVIMDIMMPKLDGIEAVKRMRARGDSTPVIFLTAKDSISDRVAGLDAGGLFMVIHKYITINQKSFVRASRPVNNIFSGISSTLPTKR